MKSCKESNENISSKLSKLHRSLERESLLNEHVDFTSKTLSDFDDIAPPVLDIIFEYQLNEVKS